MDCFYDASYRVQTSLEHLVVAAFSRPPVYDNILSRSDASSLARLSSANRLIRQATQDYARRAHNINLRLQRFFGSPLAFRSLQARTAAVISGSFAIQFFDRTFYADSDMDIYVHPDKNMLDIGLYLMSEGYTFKPEIWQQAQYKEEVERVCSYMGQEPDNQAEQDQLYASPTIRAVFTFERQTRDGALKIQVVVSHNSPLASVLDFHSTCVMNIITYNAAYSLYPYATFELREALIINDRSPQAQAALVKYAERGWRVVANPSPLVACLPHDAFHLGAERWVCDTKSWTIKLNMDGVAPPPRASPSSVPLSWDPAAECSWMLLLNQCEAQMYFETLQTTVCRWQYTAGCFPYWDVLVAFFVNQGKLEHKKVPPGKSWDQMPNAWTWWDHVLPNFRESYQRRDAMPWQEVACRSPWG